MTVRKYPISLESLKFSEIAVPEGGVVRHVGLDPEGQACLWIEVNPNLAKKDRRFVPVWTEAAVPGKCNYVGTVQAHGLVWHIYEAKQ